MEAYGPTGGLLPWENTTRGQTLALLPGPNMTMSACSPQGTKPLNKVSPTLSAPEDGLRERVLAAVGSVLCGKGQDLLSTGIELQARVAGLEPELGSPLVHKIRPLVALGCEGCLGKGEGDTGHILIPDGWSEPSYVSWVIEAARRSTS